MLKHVKVVVLTGKRKPVELAPVTEEGPAILRKFAFTKEPEGWAKIFAEEHGDLQQGFAQVVCNLRGQPVRYERNLVRPDKPSQVNFQFSADYQFALIRGSLHTNLYSIYGYSLEDGVRRCLTQHEIAQNRDLRDFPHRELPTDLLCFKQAIDAMIDRMLCPHCEHVHFGKAAEKIARPAERRAELRDNCKNGCFC